MVQRCVVQSNVSVKMKKKKRKKRTEIADKTMIERLRIREEGERNAISSLTKTVPKTVLGNLVFSDIIL